MVKNDTDGMADNHLASIIQRRKKKPLPLFALQT
jgi:hypothetical protein